MRSCVPAVVLALAACSTAREEPPRPPPHERDGGDRDAGEHESGIQDASGQATPDAAPPSDGSMGVDGTTDATTNASADALPDSPVLPVPPPGYPDGPYGTEVGDTLPYLEWQGYVSDGTVDLASELPFVPFSSADLRASSAPFTLLHVAEFFCAGCQHAAGDLSAGAGEILDAGGAIVEVLGSHGFFTRAERDHLDAWIATYDLGITTVIDAPGLPMQTIDAIGIRETALIIETATLEIVWRRTGDLGGVDPSSIDGATQEMLRLLNP